MYAYIPIHILVNCMISRCGAELTIFWKLRWGGFGVFKLFRELGMDHELDLCIRDHSSKGANSNFTLNNFKVIVPTIRQCSTLNDQRTTCMFQHWFTPITLQPLC